MLTTGHIAVYSIILVGFFNSIMFPSIFTLGIGGLGKLTGKASAIMCMAIVGGALIPEVQGLLADRNWHPPRLYVPCFATSTCVFRQRGAGGGQEDTSGNLSKA